MAVATATMAEFLAAAQASFEARFSDALVLLPDGYAQKVKQAYEGAMIVLAVEYSAADYDEEQGDFNTPTRTTLQVRVYTAVGFAVYNAKPDAYQAGLALVSDIIGWCGKRRFIEGQRGLEFVNMETVDYDVTESFQYSGSSTSPRRCASTTTVPPTRRLTPSPPTATTSASSLP